MIKNKKLIDLFPINHLIFMYGKIRWQKRDETSGKTEMVFPRDIFYGIMKLAKTNPSPIYCII